MHLMGYQPTFGSGGGGGGQNKVSRLEKEQLDCNYVLDKEE